MSEGSRNRLGLISGERPVAHSEGINGVLHVDGYARVERLAAKDDAVLAACSARTSRKFYEASEATAVLVVAEALRRTGDFMPSRHARIYIYNSYKLYRHMQTLVI
ncbi:transposase [Methylosinus sp. Sm6]|uniref:IS66 family transposase n=1 Tax=Methylosinus sp. Sm6 TaxID=2866948 RepID=UPI001C98EF1B|nr:transposase [Methylosinus sp. Sm6]